MTGKPKGAMGSPYTSNDNGPSISSLMGDAFDRLHENSWDGGKQTKEKRKKEEIEKINAEIDKKLQETELNVIENQIEAVVNNDISVVTENLSVDSESIALPTMFSQEDKNELTTLLLANKCSLVSVSDTEIIFEYNNANFKLIAL